MSEFKVGRVGEKEESIKGAEGVYTLTCKNIEEYSENTIRLQGNCVELENEKIEGVGKFIVHGGGWQGSYLKIIVIDNSIEVVLDNCTFWGSIEIIRDTQILVQGSCRIENTSNNGIPIMIASRDTKLYLGDGLGDTEGVKNTLRLSSVGHNPCIGNNVEWTGNLTISNVEIHTKTLVKDFSIGTYGKPQPWNNVRIYGACGDYVENMQGYGVTRLPVLCRDRYDYTKDIEKEIEEKFVNLRRGGVTIQGVEKILPQGRQYLDKVLSMAFQIHSRILAQSGSKGYYRDYKLVLNVEVGIRQMEVLEEVIASRLPVKLKQVEILALVPLPENKLKSVEELVAKSKKSEE